MYKTVAECYEGESVFITGGTGFLGKVLLEKLLYSCPGLEKVYILVREKKDVSAQERIQNMLEHQLFTRLRNERPQAFEKIVPIVGDVTEHNLGIKISDEKLLINKVTLIFHLAATINFNEELDVAMKINLAGTERVVNLSRCMKKIKTFVYVSTVFTNADRNVIEEVVYPTKASLDEVKKLLEIGKNEEKIKELLKGSANTYTFTKALAENVVAKNHVNVPSIIIRPSIVSCCKEEPVVGWMDSWMIASAIIHGISKGWSHVILGRPTNIVDLIPVEYVSNLIIVAASKTECSKDVTVYNCSTSAENPLTMGYLFQMVIDDSYKNKSYDLPMPFVCYTRFKWMFLLLTIILQTIPAFIADMFLLLRGKNMRYIRIQAKVAIVNFTSEFFTSHSWIIRASKTRALADSLSPSDKKIFSCNPTDIVWKEFIPTYCKGIREFLCKK